MTEHISAADYLNLTERVKRGAERKAALAQRGDSKYRNVRVDTVDGKFDSKAEHKFYLYLKVLEKAKKIKDIKRQVSYELAPSVLIMNRKKPALRYLADFVYFDIEKNKEIVADVKGAVTPEYRLKRHLMMSVHNIEIMEIPA